MMDRYFKLALPPSTFVGVPCLIAGDLLVSKLVFFHRVLDQILGVNQHLPVWRFAPCALPFSPQNDVKRGKKRLRIAFECKKCIFQPAFGCAAPESWSKYTTLKLKN